MRAFLARFSRRILSAPGFIALVALALRLATIIDQHTYVFPSDRGWIFAYEVGLIARWLAMGHGFSSPYLPFPTPTAQVAPVYPLLMAGVFKIFGELTNSSAFAM